MDLEEDRLWKFSRPEWLNSIWARNAGVYGSGALVSDIYSGCVMFRHCNAYSAVVRGLTRHFAVLARILRHARFGRVVQKRQRLRYPRQIRRLASFCLFQLRHADYQLGRKAASEYRLF